MSTLKKSNNSNWSLVYLMLGAAIISFAGVFWKLGFDEESFRLNIRLSARFSIICFCLAFGASSLHKLIRIDASLWLVQNRKYLGVSFALIHIIHLMFLVQLQLSFHPVFVEEPLFKLAPGILAYVLTILMLLTSFKVFSKLISKSNWRRLHTIGGYLLLIVFSNSMIGRVVTGNVEYLPWAALVLGVWLVRLWDWRSRKT